ncbi:MAG: hypothetical protein NHG09_00715 [Candidatus Shikimatogenerans sp. JK-2022]|nr:hypothetical protein [Candidatus Shikimatogenerans bostrichidophilus]
MKKKTKNKKKILSYNINYNKEFDIENAIKIIKKINYIKFISTINLIIKLKQKEILNFRKNLFLPYGKNKKNKILIFNKNNKIIKKIKKLNFYKEKKVIIGDLNFIENLKNKKKNIFNIIISDKYYSKYLLKINNLLALKNLIPNKEDKTLLENPINFIKKNYNKFKLILKPDKNSILHLIIGKINFKKKYLIKNYEFILNFIKKFKFNNKNLIIEKIYINSTMGPSLKLFLK